MVRVIIGDSERELVSITERWINQQISRRNLDNSSICVRVIIKNDLLNMSLSSNGCPQFSSKGRPPTRYESEIFNLWDKSKLNEDMIHGGNLISFLKKLNVS